MSKHHNKSFATFLALLLGTVGAHRFYLRKAVDRLGLLHVMAIPIAGLVVGLAPAANPFYKVLPLLLSCIGAIIEALVIGTMPDAKFDARYNAGSGKQSDTGWPVALWLVLSLGLGAVVAIATISRLFDLLYTGGAYG